jgi:hypothetical protein
MFPEGFDSSIVGCREEDSGPLSAKGAIMRWTRTADS